MDTNGKPASGFTLVELMMTIAVLGILVAVAVPLYNDYQTRARVAQVLTTIDTLRTVFHSELATRGAIPKFSAGKVGEIPPELTSFPIGPELLQFDYLDEYLIQSSTHYGPFDGKDIPYLMLVARDATQSRHLKAVAHALPHSTYAWVLEPKAMVVPLLDAMARHASHATATQPPAAVQPSTVSSKPQPQALPQPQQPQSCAAGQVKITIPAGSSPSGSAFDVCANACGPGEVRSTSNPLSCEKQSQTAPQPQQPQSCAAGQVKVTIPAGSSPSGSAFDVCANACGPGEVRSTSNPLACVAAVQTPIQPPVQQPVVQQPVVTQPAGTSSGSGASNTGTQASSRQQYNDCVAHVLAGHPHGHAWGLLKQCDRYPH